VNSPVKIQIYKGLRRNFGPKREKLRMELGKLHNLYSSYSVVKAIKLRGCIAFLQHTNRNQKMNTKFSLGTFIAVH
jgi:hypothetical protein